MAGSDQDGLILLLIESATEKLERDIERCFVQATWEQSQCSFPADGGQIKLNMGGTTSISSVSYVDTDGATQTLDPAEYSLDIGRNGITCLNDDSGWPETLSTISGRDVVTISFTCGIADGDCLPRLFKHGILLETARAYFDPAQESSIATDNGRSYEAIVRGLIRSSYP